MWGTVPPGREQVEDVAAHSHVRFVIIHPTLDLFCHCAPWRPMSLQTQLQGKRLAQDVVGNLNARGMNPSKTAPSLHQTSC